LILQAEIECKLHKEYPYHITVCGRKDFVMRAGSHHHSSALLLPSVAIAYGSFLLMLVDHLLDLIFDRGIEVTCSGIGEVGMLLSDK